MIRLNFPNEGVRIINVYIYSVSYYDKPVRGRHRDLGKVDLAFDEIFKSFTYIFALRNLLCQMDHCNKRFH